MRDNYLSKLKNISIVFLFTLFVSYNTSCEKRKVVSIADFGLAPNTGEDARPYIAEALEVCKKEGIETLVFPKGRYDFYPDSDQLKEKDILKQKTTVGIVAHNLKNFTIDGGDSEFIYHGKMEIVSIHESENITLKNFSVDWAHPMISQAEIVDAQDTYLDIKVDKASYPYDIENGKVFFKGEGWRLPILTMYSTLYEKESKEIAYNTWDASLGDIFEKPAEEIGEGIIRFHGKPAMKPEPNKMIVTLFHVRYFANGIVMSMSKDILLKNIILYHSLGNAFFGYRTENITMDNSSVIVNDAKGRYYSSIADASHFSECAGMIRGLNCAHTGQADDFINVHGTSTKITNVLDKYSIKVAAEGKGSGLTMTVGDEYWFIRLADVQRGEVNRVVKKELLSEADGGGYLITFANPIPENIQSGDFLECKTWCAGLEVRNCKILRRNRARGILVTTPKDVIIEDNYFASAGTSILLEGDFDYWYESGANNNILIRNNIFDNCLTSGNKNGSRGEWGEAVITITPSHTPKSVDDIPYHKNINISNNTFKVFDAPLVRAVSVDGLYFKDNSIIKTTDYKPYTWQKSAFLLNGCRDVVVKNNKIDDAYTTREILIENMRMSDIQVEPESDFAVKELNDVNTKMEW